MEGGPKNTNELEKQALIDEVVLNLKGGFIDKAYKIIKDKPFADEIIKLPIIQKLATEEMVSKIDYLKFNDAIRVKKIYDIPDKVIESKDIQLSIKKSVFSLLSYSLIFNDNSIRENNKYLPLITNDEIKKEIILKITDAMGHTDLIKQLENIAETFSIPDKIINSPEVQKSAIKSMISNIDIGNFDIFIKIKNKFNISDEILNLNKIYKSVISGVKRCIESNYKDKELAGIIKYFNVPQNEIQKIAIKAMIDTFVSDSKNNEYSEYKKIIKKYSISDEILKKIKTQHEVLDKLLNDDFFQPKLIQKVKEAFFITDETLKSQGVKNIVINSIVNSLADDNVNRFIKIKKAFKISDNELISPDIQQTGLKKIYANFSDNYKGSFSGIINLIEKLSIPDEILNSKEMQRNAIDGIAHKLNDFKEEGSSYILKIIDKFQINDDVLKLPRIQKAAKNAVINCIYYWDSNGALEIIKRFGLSNELLKSSKAQKTIMTSIGLSLSQGFIDTALEIQKKFSISDDIFKLPDMQKYIIDGVTYLLSINHGREIDQVVKMLEKFQINKDILSKMLTEDIISFLVNYGRAPEYVKRIQSLSLSDKLFQSTEIQEVAIQTIINKFKDNKYVDALEIIERLNVEIPIEKLFALLPKFKKLIIEVEKIYPKLKEKIYKSKSSELKYELIKISIKNSDTKEFISAIKDNPFLMDAVDRNEQYGPHLLAKYIEFDGYSKENISMLFDTKKKIMSENPDIDPESVEFRILMQESLMDFKDNKKIIAEIEKSGIKSQEWLNYEETTNFTLNSAEGTLSFAETVQTPLNRIKETIGSYSNKIKEVLKQYIEELKKAQIPIEDASQIQSQIQKMESELEKAKVEGNERKVQGIEKGLLGMRKKLETIKTVSVWEKILSDISGFDMLKNDISSAQEKLTDAENQIYSAMSEKEPSGKKITELKKILGDSKRDFQDKFMMLGKRIANFKESLLDRLSSLGKERAESLIQEIEQGLAEQFAHYDTDKDTLQNLFGEKMEKDKEVLESRPMSIFVWARNPDVDLYQGNYSPCCICIDSAHMGAESTIADYATDLGVQIVNIWDETTNKPVTAAWCWIGEDDAGKPALVVDNVESNTLYSSNYSEQLSKELLDYIKGYGKAIGINKVVLGKANNDLPSASIMSKLKDNEKTFTKLGGANRADSYFLEAEDENVKVIWDKAEKIEKKSKTEEKERIKFNDISIKSIENTDFDSIKKLEKIIYSDDLAIGQEMIEELKHSNGMEYSFIVEGVPEGKTEVEPIGYLVATEDETDEGEPCVYLDDIAVLPEAQKQGIGWKMFKNIIDILKTKAQAKNQPILFDMHLRNSSREMLDKHINDLKALGVEMTEEAFVPDHYDEGDDAVYRVYKVSI